MGSSIRSTARSLGISEATLRKLIARGRVVPTNADGTFDLATARKQYAANVRPRVDRVAPRAGRGRAGAPATYAELRRQREALKLKSEELAYKVARGELVSLEEAGTAAFNCARASRDRLLLLPDRLAHALLGITDPAEMHRLLTDEVNLICDTLSGMPPDERRKAG
jgi:hypothetical protein